MFQIVSWSFDIQLLFSHCVKCGKIRACMWAERIVSVFSPIWTESLILSKYGKIRIRFCPYTGKYGSKKARFSGYFTQCLADILSPNLDLHKNLSFVSARKLLVREYMNCLTARKLKAWKGARNLMELK